MQRRHQNYRVITPPKGLQKWDHQVITPPMVPQVQNSVSLEPPPGYAHQHTHQHQPYSSTPPPKHIIIVPGGVTFRDSTLGTLMQGEISTPG